MADSDLTIHEVETDSGIKTHFIGADKEKPAMHSARLQKGKLTKKTYEQTGERVIEDFRTNDG